MTRQIATQTQQKTPTTNTLSRGSILQRKCESCGQHIIAGGECAGCANKKSGLQRKLTIGASNDPLEREADRTAAEVMRMPDLTAQREPLSEDGKQAVQTKPIAISPVNGASLQQRRSECNPEQGQRSALLSRRESSNGMTKAGSDIESRLSSSKGGGSLLSDEVRSFMEPRFGADFSRVRVHTGSTAVQMNRDLNAQAFTYKQDVYFGAGKTPAKDSLTAHELTHVVQQTDAVRTKQGSGQATVQLKCSACENGEAEVQRLPNVSADNNQTSGEDLPGAPSACVLNAALPYAQSGILRALRGTVGEKFEIRAEWSNTPKSSRGETSYCAAECGEYHQFLKGHMLSSSNEDGSDLTDVSPRLFGGQKLDENSFQEDGSDRNPNARYGHRKEPQTMDEDYKPNRMIGSKYFGRDFPNVSTGTVADIDLTFLGKLVDTCNRTEDQSATWRVQFRGVIRP